MSKSPIEQLTSTLYDDLPMSSPIRRVTTSPFPNSPALKKFHGPPAPPIRTISDAGPRKAPFPSIGSESSARNTSEPSTPVVNVTLNASLSQKRRAAQKKEAMETFQFVNLPSEENNISRDEVEELRRKIILLESKVEELQDTVRVCSV